MDISSTVLNALLPLFWCVPVLLVFILVQIPTVKACIGRIIVHQYLCRLPKKDYRVIKNLRLHANDESSAHIDYVVISRYGIFIVEIKHMKGWILGETYQNTWQQCLSQRSYVFPNPLHQTAQYIEALAYKLDVKETLFNPAILFVGDSQFKTEMPNSVNSSIINMMRYIRSFNDVIVPDDQFLSLSESMAKTACR